MAFRIVSDSSINMTSLEGVDFRSIPMKILCGMQEFVDDADLDVEHMVQVLSTSKEKSGTSCPNIMDWKEAFEGADEILAITISGQLSGSWSSCNQAMEEYLQEVKRHYGKYCSSIQRVYLHRADLTALLALLFHALDGLVGSEQRGRPDP